MERYRRPMYQYTPINQRMTPPCERRNKIEPVMEPRGREDFALGMAYVPWQQWRDLYTPDRALCVGTIFRELDMPFLMGRCQPK